MTALRVSQYSDPRQNRDAMNRALRRTDALSLSTDQQTFQIDRNSAVTGNFNVTGFYSVAGVQVVGPRSTGWAADTGTASKAAHATYTAGATLTFSAAYTQSELTAAATRIAALEAALQAATQEIKAMKDLVLMHGLAGA